MSQGGVDSGGFRGDNRQTDPWLMRLMGKMSPDREGVSSMYSQGAQGGGMQGYVGRGQYSPIMSSSWQARLGLAPDAQYTGGPQGGNSRASTGRGAISYKGKSDLSDTDEIQKYSKDGSVAYGGNRRTFDLQYGNQNARQIAESGNIGLKVKDKSGQAVSQAPMSNLSEQEEWDKQTNMGGKGWSTESGFYNAQLDTPTDRIVFDNHINQELVGAGNVESNTTGGYDDNTLSQTLSDVTKSLDIPIVGDLLGDALKSYDKRESTKYDVDTQANQEMASGGYLNQPGMAEYNITSAGGMTNAMETPGLFDGILSQSEVSGEQGGKIDINRGGSGSLNQANYADASGGASLEQETHEWKKMFGGDHQEEVIRGGPENLQAEAGLLTEASVESQAPLQKNVPQEWIDANIDKNVTENWETYKERYPSLFSGYQTLGDYVAIQYAMKNPTASVDFLNESQARQMAEANGVSSSVEANARAVGNLSASGEGVNGDLQHAANSYAQDPSSMIYNPTYNQLNYIVGLKHWGQASKTELTGDLKGDSGVLSALVNISGQLTGNNKLKIELMRTVEDISSKLPQTEWGQLLATKLKESPELVALLNNNSTPETIAKTILNYDVRKNETGTPLIIPGVGAGMQYGAPITTSSIGASSKLETKIPRGKSMEFDPTPDKPKSGDEVTYANINGDIKEIQRGKLVSQNYIDTLNTQFDVPTGAQTGWSTTTNESMSFEEIQKSNKDFTASKIKYDKDMVKFKAEQEAWTNNFNELRNRLVKKGFSEQNATATTNQALQKSKPKAPVAPPLQTSKTTSKAAGLTPIQQQNQLNYNQYWFEGGDNEQYNTLANAGLNRYYDDTTNADYSGIGNIISEVQAGLAASPDGTYNGYTADEWNYLVDFYSKQEEYDNFGYNQFADSSYTTANQTRYY